jgi:hypothetical protein
MRDQRQEAGRLCAASAAFVIPGLVPGIQGSANVGRASAWMPGTSPGMTKFLSYFSLNQAQAAP